MLTITPEGLAGVYDMLRTWPPFNRWRLPPASAVKFRVARTRRWHATWCFDGRHHYEVSEKTHGHLSSVVATMAHEMIHARQYIAKTETPGVQHNAEFHRLAKRVCRIHGFDPGQFLGC